MENEGERRKMKCFHELSNSYSLNDALFQGQKFTWFGVREGELIKKRLDRALVNLKWMEEFPNMQVTNLLAMGSDHSPIVMNTDYKDIKNRRKFKFEASWLTVEDCRRL